MGRISIAAHQRRRRRRHNHRHKHRLGPRKQQKQKKVHKSKTTASPPRGSYKLRSRGNRLHRQRTEEQNFPHAPPVALPHSPEILDESVGQQQQQHGQQRRKRSWNRRLAQAEWPEIPSSSPPPSRRRQRRVRRQSSSPTAGPIPDVYTGGVEDSGAWADAPHGPPLVTPAEFRHSLRWDNFGRDWRRRRRNRRRSNSESTSRRSETEEAAKAAAAQKAYENQFVRIYSRGPPVTNLSRNTHTMQLGVEFNKLSNYDGPIEPLLVSLFRRCIRKVLRASPFAGPPSHIGVQLNNVNFRAPFFVPLRSPLQNSPECLAASLVYLQGQSGDTLQLWDYPLDVKVQAIWPLSAPRKPRRRRQQQQHPLQQQQKRKHRGRGSCWSRQQQQRQQQQHQHLDCPPTRSRHIPTLVEVRNTRDHWCLARAIAIGVQWHHCERQPKSRRFLAFVSDVEGRQRRAARRLLQRAGCSLRKRYYDFRDAAKIARVLGRRRQNQQQQQQQQRRQQQQFRIVVLRASKFHRVAWRSSQMPTPNDIVLVLQRRHYNFIGEPRHLFKARGYCLDCEKRAYPRISHNRQCRVACRLCYRFGAGYPCRPAFREKRILCRHCGFVFPNSDCYRYHRRTRDDEEDDENVVGAAATSSSRRRRQRTSRRTFISICKNRRFCRHCGVVVYRRSSVRHPHQCRPHHPNQSGSGDVQSNFTSNNITTTLNGDYGEEEVGVEEESEHTLLDSSSIDCKRCGVLHDRREPFCYIQPLKNERETDDGEGCPSDQETVVASKLATKNRKNKKGKKNAKPVRYIFYDIETSQERKIWLKTPTPSAGENVAAATKSRVHIHEPLLLIAEVLCAACMDAGFDVGVHAQRAQNCVCGVFGPRFRYRKNQLQPGNRRTLVFHSFDDETSNCVDESLDFLLFSGPRYITTILIAHNGGKYDHHLLLNRLFVKGIVPTVVASGLKLYSVEIRDGRHRHVVMKDSLNFFASKLSSLYRTFDLQKDGICEKPWFPYLFIRRRFLDLHLNQLPPRRYYAPKHMHPEERSKFLAWFRQNRRSQGFHLRSELIAYCANDVRILSRACQRFRQQLRCITTKVEPFVSASTIARLSMNIFRAEFLQPNRLCNLPEGGINIRGRQSYEALRFLRTIALLTGWRIRTAEWVEGEHRTPPDPLTGYSYRVDGFVEPPPPQATSNSSSIAGADDVGSTDTHNIIAPNNNQQQQQHNQKLALEFYGCWAHGCPSCFPLREAKLAGGKTADELLQRTQRRAWTLEHELGYRLIEVWQCEWRERLRHTPGLQQIYDHVFVPPPLDPRRHCLRGGRTEAFTMLFAPGPNEVFEYFDIISMYPWVMKYGHFPVGQPRLVVIDQLLEGNLAPLPWTTPAQNPFMGLILCRVLPPRGQMNPPELPPFLPYFSERQGKLFFTLCAACADSQQCTPCAHSPEQRSWISGFTHIELNKALTLGYLVLDIFEVEHYPQEQWAHREKGNGLFGAHIDAALKLKVQSSGWPSGVVTPEQRSRYIAEFYAAEGIQLREEEISVNPGLRGISKLLLNSAWGKFCQKTVRTEVRYTSSASEMHALLEDPALEVLDLAHLTSRIDRLIVRHLQTPDLLVRHTPATNNTTVACFVTSQARLRLFTIFEEAVAKRNRLHYCDTDGAMVSRSLTDPPLTTGTNLGDLAREMPNRKIIEIVIAGAKNYAIFHVDAATGGDPQYLIKVRGITLTYAARKRVTFERMKELILSKFGTDFDAEDFRSSVAAAAASDESGPAVDDGPTLHFPQIDRDIYGRVFTRRAKKQYKIVFDKRIVVDNGQRTLPFGYTFDPS